MSARMPVLVSKRWVVITGVVTLCVPLLVMFVAFNYLVRDTAAINSNGQTVADCVAKRSGIVAGEKNIRLYEGLVVNCFNEVRYDALIKDFAIRRDKFYGQDAMGNVLLWMVVLLTLSGVALSAFQLYASYQQGVGASSEAGGAHELSISRDSLSVRSAYVGVVILAISFAFFAVFVFQVYVIKPMARDSADKEVASTINPLSALPKMGELGQMLQPGGNPPSAPASASPAQ